MSEYGIYSKYTPVREFRFNSHISLIFLNFLIVDNPSEKLFVFFLDIFFLIGKLILSYPG